MRLKKPWTASGHAFCLLALLFATAALTAQTTWVGVWGAASSADANEGNLLGSTITLREIVHVSRGGTGVRVTLSNELGTDPLTIAAAHLGIRSQGSGLVPGSDQPLLFGGQPSTVIPAGASAVSDPLPTTVAPLSDLAITLLVPAQPLHTITAHDLAVATNYLAEGDQLNSPTLTAPKTFTRWRFLKNVEVRAGRDGAAVVTLGDSITDGYRSTPDTNRRWPDELAIRLQADSRLRHLAVLNEGISGNRILHDGAGPNALARFDRDVLSQSGVRYLVVLEGINDIGNANRSPVDAVTAQQVILGYEQMIERAHAHGIKVYGATLTPFLGAGYANASGEAMRQAVNTWIRTSGRFDAVLDFDAATRDPAHPQLFNPSADSGDHLHPGDAGYKTMGDSIDLSLFRR